MSAKEKKFMKKFYRNINKKNKKYNTSVTPMQKAKEPVKRFTEFEAIAKMTQKEVKEFVTEELKKYYPEVIVGNGYVLANGTHPVMLCAHMDTVHKEVPKEFVYTEKSNVLSSPQGIGGDDRCGIYMVLSIAREINCTVLFLEDEEIGCIGASKFCADFDRNKVDVNYINYIIEFDRRGKCDAVYYDLDNEDFEDFITNSSDGHFKTNWGTCSDICYLAPTLRVAAVNLSCGYYHEHHLDETVNISEMKTNIEKAKLIINTAVDKPYEWNEIRYNKSSWYDDNWGYGYGGYDFSLYKEKSSGFTDIKKNDISVYEVWFVDDDGNECIDYVEASSETEAIGAMLMDFPNLCYNMVYYAELKTDRQVNYVVDRIFVNGEEVEI